LLIGVIYGSISSHPDDILGRARRGLCTWATRQYRPAILCCHRWLRPLYVAWWSL